MAKLCAYSVCNKRLYAQVNEIVEGGGKILTFNLSDKRITIPYQNKILGAI